MIELITVLVVLALLIVIVGPRLSTIITQTRVNRAASAIQNDVEAAFAIASRNRQPIRIQWNSGAMELGVTNRAGTTTYRRTLLAHSEYQLKSSQVTVSDTPLVIFPNGLASDTLHVKISVEIGSSTFIKRVRVSRAGLVQIL